MHIYLSNNLAEFHLDPIWNDGALGFLKSYMKNIKHKNKNKMSSDIGPVLLKQS